MKNQNQKTRIRTLYIGNAIYRVLYERNTASFAELLKFQEKVTFTHTLWVNSGKLKKKKKKQSQYAIHFEIATYRVLHERSNNTASFVEHLKIQGKVTLHIHFWLIEAN